MLPIERDGPLRVLIAEDDASLREMLCLALGARGFAVESAPNGWEALLLVRSSRPFDLLLFDEEMPRLKGRAALKLLRAEGVRAGAVLMSGSADVGFDEQAQLGIDFVLHKPLDLDDLCQALEDSAPDPSF